MLNKNHGRELFQGSECSEGWTSFDRNKSILFFMDEDGHDLPLSRFVTKLAFCIWTRNGFTTMTQTDTNSIWELLWFHISDTLIYLAVHIFSKHVYYGILHMYMNYKCITSYTGWWFGTSFIFPYIGNVIIPIDELIFFRGVFPQPPTSIFRISENTSPPSSIRLVSERPEPCARQRSVRRF